MSSSTDRPKIPAAVPRSRGVVSGFLLMAFGVWGALLPFLGPYAHFGFSPDASWHWTAARFWLQVLPGAVTFVAGLLVVLAGNRVAGMFGGVLAIAAGLWFVTGPILADLHRSGYIGTPLGGNRRQHFEWLASFFGLGAVIAVLGALAVGRLSVVGVRDVATWEKRRADRDRRADEQAAVYPSREAVAEGGAGPVEEPTREVPVRLTNIRPSREDVEGSAPVEDFRTDG